MNKKLLIRAIFLMAIFALIAPVLAQDDVPTLRVTVLPVLNTMPLFVAQHEDFFIEEGVNVEFVPVASAPERDAVFIAGEADGMNTDLPGVVLLVNGGFDTRVVRLDPPAGRFFAVLAARDSGIENVQDLSGVEIGLSSNTVIDYTTSVLLREGGLEDDEIVGLEMPDIRQRLTLLLEGQLQAATLPEPLTAVAMGAGATVIVDDSESDYIPTVLAFSQTVLEENPEAVAAFLRGYERAVEAINENPEDYREVLVNDTRFPDNEALRENYPVPEFLPASVPTEEQVQAMVNWMLERELIDEAITYEELVDGAYLPEVSEDEETETESD